MCPRCRLEVAAMERLGGAIVAELAPVAFERPDPLRPLPTGAGDPAHNAAGSGDAEIPGPMAGLIRGGLDAVSWRRLGPGVWDHNLQLTGAGRLRLLKVSPGRSVPEHGHGGAELTLVLRGSFHDETGRYVRGDVADLDETVEHKPITDSQSECICLIASEQPERFHGLIARLLQPLHGR
jgi:putative transcriptional regulator